MIPWIVFFFPDYFTVISVAVLSGAMTMVHRVDGHGLIERGTTHLHDCDTRFWSVIGPYETCITTIFDIHVVRRHSCLIIMVMTLTEISLRKHSSDRAKSTDFLAIATERVQCDENFGCLLTYTQLI